MSPRSAAPDQTSLFLLPLLEVPHYVLTNPKPNSSQRKRYYDACDVKRSSRNLLMNGSVDENHSGLFRLQPGDCVFLRPQESALRPGIGKVTTFFDCPPNSTGYARVQWFYRSEDLSKSPKEASGEDEVFETDHFDDVEIESIAGRCDVSSYATWINSNVREVDSKPAKDSANSSGNYCEKEKGMQRKASKVIYQRVIDIEQMPDEVFHPGEDISTVQRARTKRYKVRRRKTKQVLQAKESAAMSVRSTKEVTCDPSFTGLSEEREDMYGNQRGGRNQDDSDAQSDVQSSYMDNYEGSAIRYYCRRFYDPRMHIFLTSKYEDDFADPLEELTQQLEELGDDDFLPRDTMSISSSDDGALCTSDEEVAKSASNRKKQKLSRTGQKRIARRRKSTTAASQFALPMDSRTIPSLPCRDSQKEHVRDFLLDFINGAETDSRAVGSRCLYISGVPGTGKTATVREVVRQLSARRATGDIPHFDVLEVNSMSLPDPNLVYSELYAAITGGRGVAPSQAAQLLEKKFANLPEEAMERYKKRRRTTVGSRKRESCIILILDEMDVLMARKQKVLYDMLEWPTRKNARMAVIGIANTMDLPERMLPRLGSRLGLNRLSYPPYTSDQIRTILELRLDQSKVKYSPEALKFCAAKVGAVSGDVRRALELCRRALECAEEKAESSRKGQNVKVTIEHVNQAINAIAGGCRLKSLTQLSLFEKVFLLAAVTLSRREGACALDITNSVEAVIRKTLELSTQLLRHFQKSGIPSSHELQEACQRLSEQRFVLIEKSSVFLKSRVVVNVSAEDCSFALRDCPLSNAVLSGNT
ncbi:Origin recognition complex subunit 1 [Gracilaria domingensis]|nr:Origin recognition complex subunit 1 [Gracilaria domingensis]